MGQSRIVRSTKPGTFSTRDINAMVGVLINKFGGNATSVARMLADEHARAGDRTRSEAWAAVAKEVKAAMARGSRRKVRTLH